LTVSGNTTSNKLTITSRLVSSGNNVLGAAGKTQIVNGILASNGNVTVTKNVTISGNTTSNKATISSSLVSSGNTTIAGLIANASLGTSNQVLKTNGATVFWGDGGSAGQSNVFSRALVGTTSLYADGTNDTLSIQPGYGISLTATVANDTIVISASNILASNAYVSANYTVKANPVTSGLLAHTGRVTISQNLDVSGNTIVTNARINGTLNANGQINLGATTAHKVTLTGVLQGVNAKMSGNTTLGGAGKKTIATGKFESNGYMSVNGRFDSTGNTNLGGSGKRTIVNGVLTANGRATIGTNIEVTGNTTSNKIIVTNRFESRANNVLGAAGKTQIVNGILASNGNVTVTKNVTISGNCQVLALGVGTTPGTNGSIRSTENITAYYSDERLKNILGLIENPLDKIATLRGFYFEPNYIAQQLGYTLKREVGVSAQEVNAILPEIIAPAPISELYMTVHYEKLIPLLIEGIKALTRRVEELEKNDS
jgi:hypothetical protein